MGLRRSAPRGSLPTRQNGTISGLLTNPRRDCVPKRSNGLFLSSAVLLRAVLLSGPALAHAHLQASAPAAGEVLAAPPARVSLTFSEALETQFSSVAVTDGAGLRVDSNDLAAAAGDAKTVRIDLRPLRAGRYTVTWRAVSVDTHRTQGSFVFSVGP